VPQPVYRHIHICDAHTIALEDFTRRSDGDLSAAGINKRQNTAAGLSGQDCTPKFAADTGSSRLYLQRAATHNRTPRTDAANTLTPAARSLVSETLYVGADISLAWEGH